MNDGEKLDNPQAADKRLRSSAGGVFDLNKHCLFYHDITLCTLPPEYDAKVPHQYIMPASPITTDKMADSETYKHYLLKICQKPGYELL